MGSPLLAQIALGAGSSWSNRRTAPVWFAATFPRVFGIFILQAYPNNCGAHTDSGVPHDPFLAPRNPSFATCDLFFATRDPFLGACNPFLMPCNPFFAPCDPFLLSCKPFFATRKPFLAARNPFLVTCMVSVACGAAAV